MRQLKKVTSEEFLRTLEADPEYVRRRAEQDEKFAKLVAYYRDAEAPLVDELRALGFQLDSVWDLVNTNESYDEAIPLLLDHLRREYPDAIREGIARSLGVPATRPLGWQDLINEYRLTKNENNRVKDGLAVGLSGAADDSVIQDLMDLAKDRRNGESRGLLLSAIRKSKRPEAKQAIVDLADDPQLAREIKSWRRSPRRSR